MRPGDLHRPAWPAPREDAVETPPEACRDIAVVGLACRFPGAPDAASFWQALRAGRHAVREVPADRWDAHRYYAPAHGQPGKASTLWGAFLDGIAEFDAAFFLISPREAKSVDPQHRLLLEVAYEALEDAGQPLKQLEGSRTGVFVGICGSEYATLSDRGDDYSRMDKYFGTGTALSVAAGRIAYSFNLNGPAVSIETACSSSLVALHLAVSSLRLGEADLCIAGGVNVALSPAVGIYFSQIGAVSREPACRPFAADADGYVRGEGCGLVLLKRLHDALRDGDRVLAVVKGSAINQDGRSAGLTAPNGAAQEAAIRAALADGRVGPARIGYIEAHGTGTRLGDPIEARALGSVYGSTPEREEPLLIGAVKANIGHLEAAAGIAGFIKAVLALNSGVVPPQINVRERNSLIDWDALHLGIAPTERPWPVLPDGAPALAAVSSFGFSGTNAHVVLGPPPHALADVAKPPATGFFLLPVSARAPAALAILAAELVGRLRAPDLAEAEALARLSRGMALRRSHHPLRLCAVGASAAALAEDLSVRARPEAVAALRPARDGGSALAFVFSGQGSMWVGMGAALAGFPPAKACLDEIDEQVRAEAGWSLLDMMDEPAADGDAPIQVAQTCVFAAQMALVRLLAAWGIRPIAVAGHSMGEIAAACAAGALTLAEATRLALVRSRLLKRASGQGLMAAVELGHEHVAALVARAGLPVGVAAVNGPGATVVSGPIEAVRAALHLFEAEGAFCRVLRTGGVAGHSPLLLPLRDDLRLQTTFLNPRDGEVAFVSSVDGEVRRGRDLGPGYWGLNLIEPVRFDRAMAGLVERGARTILEIAPKPLLIPVIRQALQERGLNGSAMEVMHPDRPAGETLARALAGLYEAGHELDWRALCGDPGGWIAGPAYPWQRERHWVTDLDPAPASTPPAGTELPEERALRALVRRWDEAGVLSVNMRNLAPHVLLSEDHACALYLAVEGRVCLVWAYLGPPDRFAGTIKRLKEACVARSLALCLVSDESGAQALAGIGFALVALGASHRIEPLSAFDPKAPGLKRLRGRLQRYAADGGGTTESYLPGRSSEDDAAALALIEGWSAKRGRRVPAADAVAAEIRAGIAPPHRRYLVARRGGRILALFVLARFGTGTGYLLDLEFYDETTPPGCTEAAIADIAAILARDGARALSLGGSYSAAPGASGVDGHLARQLRYKRKFGAAEAPLLLLRPPDLSPAQTDDLVALTSGARTGSYEPRIATTLDALLSRPAYPTISPAPAPDGPSVHPLLGRALSLAGTTLVFESRIAASDRLVSEHIVQGEGVLPGAAYLEMAAAAVWDRRQGRNLVLRDVVFERPLTPPEGGGTRVQTLVETHDGEAVRFAIHAEPDSGHAWRRLAFGRIAFEPEGGMDALPVPPPDARPVDVEAIRARLAEVGVRYGPLFNGLRRVEMAGRRIAAAVEWPDAGLPDPIGYRLHPALLDAALQSFAAADEAGGRGFMVQSVEELRIAAPLLGPLTVAAAVRPEASKDLAVGDLAIADAEGRTVVQARGILARVLPNGPAVQQIGRIELVPAEPRPAEGALAGLCLVAGGGDLGKSLERVLRAEGHPVRRLPWTADALPAALGAVEAGLRRDARALVLLPDLAAEAARPSIGLRLASFPDLVRLIATDASPHLRVWIVTRGAFGPDSSPATCAEAGLWGLGAVLRAEHREIWGGLCDVTSDVPDDAAARTLAAILADAGGEDSWVVTPQGARVPRLALASVMGGPGLRIAPDGAYLLTGWSGGVGRRVARWLVEERAGRLVLLARRPPDPVLAEDMRRGAARTALSFRVGDAADPACVAAALADAESAGQRLRGVFHAAGALADGLLINRHRADFCTTFAGKVQGAWNLHRQTLGRDLDAFVLFSSSASLFGPPAQAAHAAAAAAMDRVAALRRAGGRRAVSIGWGPWGGVGKAAELVLDTKLASDGILPVDPDRAMEMMAALAVQDLAQAYIAPIDWERWRAASPALADRPLFALQVRGGEVDEPTPEAVDPVADSAEIGQRLCGCAAASLLCDPGRIDRSRSLEMNGLDSIMIVEVRERLGRELGRPLPLIDFFREPSIDRLAAKLTGRMELEIRETAR